MPDAVPLTDVTEWSDEVDVLVLGAGMAGVARRSRPPRPGARVLVIDRGGP